MAAGFSDSTAPAVTLSPEAVETARRAYSAGNPRCLPDTQLLKMHISSILFMSLHASSDT